jgi:hypothetical protein
MINQKEDVSAKTACECECEKKSAYKIQLI